MALQRLLLLRGRCSCWRRPGLRPVPAWARPWPGGGSLGAGRGLQVTAAGASPRPLCSVPERAAAPGERPQETEGGGAGQRSEHRGRLGSCFEKGRETHRKQRLN